MSLGVQGAINGQSLYIYRLVNIYTLEIDIRNRGQRGQYLISCSCLIPLLAYFLAKKGRLMFIMLTRGWTRGVIVFCTWCKT